MNTTPKLIEDTVMSWASTADKFGLKLVQVPIAEAAAISDTQPFRRPYRIQLKVPPPKAPVPTLFNNTSSFAQSDSPDPLYFQKALLRKFDFVLDFEPRSAFPQDVEVSYSWGTPDYRYPQYIHRSGSILAQITEAGDFLLLANRLVSTRGAVSRDRERMEQQRGDSFRPHPNPMDRISPRLSPLIRPVHNTDPLNVNLNNSNPLSPQPQPHQQQQHQPSIDSANLYRAPEHILTSLEEFCNDTTKLQQFYSESHHARPASTSAGPAALSFMETSIPSLELPASVVSHHISPPAGLPTRVTSDSTPGSSSGGGTRPRNDSRAGYKSPRSGGLRPLMLS